MLHFSWGINADLNAGEKLFKPKTAAAIWWAIRRVEPKWCWARVNYLTVVLSAKNLWSHLHYILQWSSVPTPESHLFSIDRQMYIRQPFGVWAVIQWPTMIGGSELIAFRVFFSTYTMLHPQYQDWITESSFLYVNKLLVQFMSFKRCSSCCLDIFLSKWRHGALDLVWGSH